MAPPLPMPGSPPVGLGQGSNESDQVLPAPLLHLLVESTHGVLFEVRRLPVRIQRALVPVLLINKHGVRLAVYLVGNVAHAPWLLARGQGQLAQDFGHIGAIFRSKLQTNHKADHRIGLSPAWAAKPPRPFSRRSQVYA